MNKNMKEHVLNKITLFRSGKHIGVVLFLRLP